MADALDALVQRLKDGSRAFAKLAVGERIQLCERIRMDFAAVADESAAAACRAKGVSLTSPIAGEEWISGPMISLRMLRQTVQSLRDIKDHGAPRVDEGSLRELADGRLSLRVYPASALDSLMVVHHAGEVHFQEGITPRNFREHQAAFYRRPHEGKLCVVLGGGNINSIAPTDALYKMFTEGMACILKMNPVNAYLGPFLERAFRAAIERGFFAVTYGGADEGSYLVKHPLVDSVHITGSDRTHDLMVWGPPGPEREARRKRNEPLLTKEITSELGNISPLIFVPGPYDDGELGYQAASIAGMVTHNASFNCNATKLIVTSKAWARRHELIERISGAMANIPVRQAFYPGSEERWAQLTRSHANARLLGKGSPGHPPWAFIPDVDSSNPEEAAFGVEPWCGVVSETALPGDDPVTFLERAVKFVNERVWGTLCASIVVHPATLQDRHGALALEKAIADLRYGTVCINTWPAAAFALGQPPWGAHPSESPQHVQSGRGFVHNTLMLGGIEKAVLRAPVKVLPVPPWFPGYRTLRELGQQLVQHEINPSWLKVPALAALALRA